ncbi:hypothetical protein [Glycomyces tritici]|uniref:Uncharacterized protein n=1 Tax=Glycomyces tritici TaxID=2665176 RepID=A0ABT7YWW9_9ACTN|nr:hypothetical protein [Glycomyces tritici]MDN3243092.1 hypothetical protein [Glycomyces tritici]
MNRLASPPRPKPNRSESAVILSFSLAVILLACAVFLLDAAGPARDAAAETLLDDNDDFGASYLPQLDAIVNFRFVYPAVGCLLLAAAFTALAVASRIGPRWSVIVLGVFCAVGALGLVMVAALRLMVDIPIGDYEYDELTSWLKAGAPSGFESAEEIPVLTTLFGLPLIGALLTLGHHRNRESD